MLIHTSTNVKQQLWVHLINPIHVYIYIYIYIHTHTIMLCMYVYMCIEYIHTYYTYYLCIYIYICLHTLYIHTYPYIYISMYIYIYIHICTYMCIHVDALSPGIRPYPHAWFLPIRVCIVQQGLKFTGRSNRTGP